MSKCLYKGREYLDRNILQEEALLLKLIKKFNYNFLTIVWIVVFTVRMNIFHKKSYIKNQK